MSLLAFGEGPNSVQINCVAFQNVGDSPSKLVFHSGANCLLLFGNDGEVCWMCDANCENLMTPGPFRPGTNARTDDRTLLEYSRDYRCLLMISGKLVSLRRDLAGSLFIRTSFSTVILQSPDGDSPHVEVELTVSEGMKLKKYLESPHINLASDHSKDVLDQLVKQLGASVAEDRFVTVSLSGQLDCLSSLFSSILNDLKRTEGSPVLPVAAGMLERLSLFRSVPYNFQLSIDGNGLDKAVMASEAARRLTFSQWPHMHYRWALPDQMAQAGFYHQPNTTGDDRVMCFTCSVCLVCWEPSDEPWSEHERHSPHCPFVRGEYTHNVPLGLTFASTPAVEHMSKQEFVCLSTTSKTVWMAAATEHGNIQLWHLNSLPQKGLEFSIDLADAYIGMKTCYVSEVRRPTRVTWSDDSTKSSGLSPSEPDSFRELISEISALEDGQGVGGPSSEDLGVTALCSCGKPTGVPPLGRTYTNPDLTCSAALVVGFRLKQSRLRPPPSTENPLVEVLNSVNRAAGPCSVRIVPPDEEESERAQYHPFILVYKIDENASGLGKGGAKTTAENRRENPADASSLALSQHFLGSMDLGFVTEEAEVLSEMEEELMGLPPVEDPWTEDVTNNNSALIDPLVAPPPPPPPPQPTLASDFSLGMDGTSKTSAAANSGDFLQVHYRAPSANLMVLQCFRLPDPLDSADFRVDFILPSTDGCFVLVVVNKEEKRKCKDEEVVSGLVLYRLTFSGLMTGLIELPVKEKVFRGEGMRINKAVLFPSDTVGLEFQNGERIDAVSILNENGVLCIVDLDSEGPLFMDRSGVRYLDLTGITSDKMCGLSDAGELRLLQIFPPVFEQEDVLDSGIDEILNDPNSFDVAKFLPGPPTDYLVRRMFTKETLYQAWELTRSEWSNGVHFVAAAPSCWTEIQQHQRLRKNPQHYLREDKVTKSWQLTPNEETWKQHTFELILPNSVSVSHIDFRFSLQAMCYGAPDIQVTLCRKKPTREGRGGETVVVNGMEVEVVSGPFSLSEAMDLSETSGLVQITSPVLQSYKSRQFLLYVQALTEESEVQKTWRHSQKDFLQQKKDSYEKVTAVKSQYEERAKPQHHPGYYGFGLSSKDLLWKTVPLKPLLDVKKMEDRKGCDWLEEISITVWRTKKTAIPKERFERTCLMASLAFHKEIGNILRGSVFEKETESGFVFLQQHLALDLCAWLFSHWSSRNAENLILAFSEEVLKDIGGIFQSCFIRASRSVSHKSFMMLVELLSALKRLSVVQYRCLVDGLLSGIQSVLPRLSDCRSSGSLMWLFSVFSYLARSDPLSSRELLPHFLAVLIEIGGELESRHNEDTSRLHRRGLKGSPLELDMYEWPPPVLSSQLWKNPSQQQYSSYAAVAAQGTQTYTTAWFSSEIGQDEVDWEELLQVESVDAEQQFQQPSVGGVNWVGKTLKGKRSVLSREHLQGLMEVEPLSFACQTASEGVRVENMETGVVCSVGSGPLGSSTGPGPIPLPDMAQVEGTGHVNPALANAVSSMKQQVQSILSKQMQLLALQQQKQKLTGKLQEHAGNSGMRTTSLSGVDPSGTPAGSSASTFGVPTTPKTTPFMTPTPLSPTQLSPINSETNLHFDEECEHQVMPLNHGQKEPMHLMPMDLLKPPPYRALILDRMSSGGRKFLVLDFGRPVLLTDLIIPCSGELASVCIDVWLKGEGLDGHRLVVCNDITHKSLVVSDLQPPALCRFLKITYIGRHGLGTCSCKIPLGSFHGYRFIAPWQLYPYGDMGHTEKIEALQPPVSLKHLKQLAEDLRCKHQLASSQLKRLLEEDAEDILLREAYRESTQTKLQWNLARRIIDRLGGSGKMWSETGRSWSASSTDQLRVTVNVVLAALTRMSGYMALAEKIERSSLLLDVHTATSLFRQLCVQGSPRIQALCSAWLFQWGTGSFWWGEFFVVLLKNLFSNSSPEQSEDLFFLLCYLAGQSVRAGCRTMVVDLLKLLLRTLEEKDKPLDSTLLTWLLYLLSVCFDVASGCSSSRRKSNRWSFLAGDWNPSSRDSSTGDKDSSSRKKLARKPVAKVKWEETAGMGMSLMEEQYQKTLALAEDIKQYVGKPGKQSPGTSKIRKTDSKSKHSKRSKHTTRKRTRNAVRLKIPEELSVTVARMLTDLLISDRVFLPPLACLVAFKIVAKSCCESVKPVGLSQVFDEKGLEEFIQLALDNRRSAWTRHAVSCVVLDILEAEHKHKTVARLPAFSIPEIPVADSLFAGDASEQVTKVASAPDTPAGAQQAIDAALADIQLSPIPGCAIDDETRKKQLILLCKEMIHSNLNSGLPFSGLENWVKTAKDSERNLAGSCTSAQQYRTRVSKFLMLHSNSKDYLFDFIQSSMSSSSSGGGGAFDFPSHIPPPSSYAAHGPPAPYPFFPLIDSAAASSSTNPGYAEAKEKLSKLCEQLQMSNTTTSVFLGGTGSLPPQTSATGDTIVVDINLDSIPGGEEASLSGESAQGSPTQTEVDDSLQDTQTDILHSMSLIASRVMCLDVEVKKNVEQLQPVSLSLDERSESHLGWRAEVESKRALFFDETLCRMALKNFVPVSKPLSLVPSETEGRVAEGWKPSLEALSTVLSSLFSALSPVCSVPYAERLLSFFWNILSGVSAMESMKSLESEPLGPVKSPILPLTVRAVQSLLSYLSHTSDISGKVWTTALRVLSSAANIRDVDVDLGVANQGSGMAGVIVSSKDFPVMLNRFVGKAVDPLGGVGCLAGPAVIEALGTFLTRLHMFCDVPDRPVGRELKVSVLQIVIDILSNDLGDAVCPVDVLSKVVEFLLGQEFESLPGDILRNFVSAVAKKSRKFLLHCEPVTGSTLGSGAANPRFCFQTGSPEPTGTEFRTFTDKHDVLVSNLLRLSHEICATQQEHPIGETDDAKSVERASPKPAYLVDVILERDCGVCEDLLVALSLCYSNSLVEGPKYSGKTPIPSLITVADWTLQVLTTISRKLSNSEGWMKPVVRFLSCSGDESEQSLSGPLVYFFKSVLDTKEKTGKLLELGGAAALCQHLLQSPPSPEWENLGAQSRIIRQLASVSSQIKGSENGSGRPSRKNLESKVEGMTNYAPLCQITSSSPMAHHLIALLTSTPPHRRARTAAWTYHFYPAESWLDLLLTLPYPILLKEIQIRPHLPSLQTGPSALQVELGSENNPYCLSLLGPPVSTTGCSKIRISTEGFQKPVQMVKIHVKRPADSVNMGMSQILLLGHSPFTSLSDSDGGQESKNDFGFWISLLHHVLSFDLGSGGLKLFRFVQLASKLILIFLSRSVGASLRNQLSSVLQSMDSYSDSRQTIVHLLLEHCRRDVVRDNVFPWLNDLLCSLCRRKSLEEARLSELVRFSCEIVMVGSLPGRVSANLLWCTACVTWDSMERTDGFFTEDVIEALFILACKWNSGLSDAAGWMLCSLCKDSPSVFNRVLGFCGLCGVRELANVTDDGKQEAVDRRQQVMDLVIKPSKELMVLSRACLSPAAAQHLLDCGIMDYLADCIELLCTTGASKDESWQNRLSILVQFFATVSTVAVVKEWLFGTTFMDKLLKTITHESFGRSSQCREIERNTIRLIQTCIACHYGHQKRFSGTLCEILDKITAGGLNGAMQELILSTLLDEERLVVLLDEENAIETSPVLSKNPETKNNGKFWHPKFGCVRKRKVLRMSSFSTCQDLLPPLPSSGRSRTGKTEKRVSISQDLWNPQLPTAVLPAGIPSWIGASPSSLGEFPGDYGKAKRSDGGEKKTADVKAPDIVHYLVCEEVSDKPLSRTETMAKIYCSVKDDQVGADLLRLKLHSCSAEELKALTEAEGMAESPKSILEVFASAGGLASLAQHLQLYQPSITVRPQTTRSGFYSEKELYWLEQQKMEGTGAFDPTSYYDPFEFIDMTSPGTSYYAPIPDGSTSQIRGQGERLQGVASAGLSPHVVVAFSVFLRLNGYAELLVGEDRRRAQRLLRLTMGITSESELPARTEEDKMLGVRFSASDNDSLSLLPFTVLGSLFSQNPWNTDAGRLIRKASVDLSIPELLLVCLSAFSHHQSRFPEEEFSEAVSLVEQLLTSSRSSSFPTAGGGGGTVSTSSVQGTEERNQFWAKGTGFGTGTTQQQWNMDLHVLKRKQDEENVTCLLKVLADFISPVDWSDENLKAVLLEKLTTEDLEWVPQRLVTLLNKSCVVPTLAAYLRNDSVLDISRHTKVYEAVLHFLCALALQPSLGKLLTEESSEQSEPLSVMICKLKDCIEVYMRKLKPLSEKTVEEKAGEESANEEGLAKLVPLVDLACCLVSKRAGDRSTPNSETSKTLLALSGDDRYMAVMKEVQFQSVPFFDESGAMCVGYHYESSVRGCRDTGSLAPRVRRLAQEAVTLSTSLPLSPSSSVFVRAAEERLDVMKVLITGPEGTPYWNGCFEFDIWFPTDYPTSPMHVNLQTTGGHTVRFNPNLYNDGKVCLSVLNTWHGRPEERWNPQTSSFLQVLVSIQSLILVPDPYFNEPGYERSRGTPAGQQAAREYDANIRQATVRWGMVEMLRSAPRCFKDVLERHFWLKKDEILGQVAGWIAEMEAQLNETTSTSGNPNEKRGFRNFGAHLAALKRHAAALKELLMKLEDPLKEMKTEDVSSPGKNKVENVEALVSGD